MSSVMADSPLKVKPQSQWAALHKYLLFSMRTNITLMHNGLSWLTVLKRLSFNSLMLFKSVTSNYTPVFIHSQIIFSNTAHGHNTRNASNGHLVTPYPRTTFLKRSFIYRALPLWNHLPRELHFIESRLTFKKYLKLLLIQ